MALPPPPNAGQPAEEFVQGWQGHGDTICGLTNKGRIFVRMRDRTAASNTPMRWYEVKSPDFSVTFEPHRP